MKKCKKLLCLVLALVMALSLCTVAMADETPYNVTKINFTAFSGYGYGKHVSGFDTTAVSWKVTGSSTDTTDDPVDLNGPLSVSKVGIYTKETEVYTELTDPDAGFELNKQYYLGIKGTMHKVGGSGINGAVISDPSAFDNILLTANGWGGSNGIQGEGIEIGSTENENQEITVYFKLPVLTQKGDPYEVSKAFTKVVKLGGNTAPGTTTFKLTQADVTTFESSTETSNSTDIWNDYEVSGTVTVTGANTVKGTLTVSGAQVAVEAALKRGIPVKEVNGGLEGWTYDDTVWIVRNMSWNEVHNDLGSADTSENDNYVIVAKEAELTGNGYVGKADKLWCYVEYMTFTNKYTENTTHEHTRRQPTTPTTPEAPKPVASPKTGDMGVALYAAMALLSMSGSAVIIGKKRSK